MNKYRRKPEKASEVTAIRYHDGQSLAELAYECGKRGISFEICNTPDGYKVIVMQSSVLFGSWVVFGAGTAIRFVGDTLFRKEYEEVLPFDRQTVAVDLEDLRTLLNGFESTSRGMLSYVTTPEGQEAYKRLVDATNKDQL